jgi:probable F420-dependent oxidoreductase
MHVGLKVPSWGPLAGPDAVARTAVAADERGFGSVWVSDHVAVPATTGNYDTGLDPRTPFLDPLTTLAFVAGQTRHVQLGTGVYVLPLRHALTVAKEAGTVDVLSSGRLLFGVGVGWLREEFELLGAGWTDRGGRTDAAIRTLRDCWSPRDAAPGVEMWPRPAGAVPILVGGHSVAALARAVRLGDGWYGSGLSATELGDIAQRLDRDLRSERPGERLLVGCRVAVVETADSRRVVDEFARAGADFVILDTAPVSVDDAVEWVCRTADTLGLDGTARSPLVSQRSWRGS